MTFDSRVNLTEEEFYEGRDELRAQIAAGVLDVGEDDSSHEHEFGIGKRSRVDSMRGKNVANEEVDTCFYRVCIAAGVSVSKKATSVSDLSAADAADLAAARGVKVLLQFYGADDPRNHVELVTDRASNARVTVQPVSEPANTERTLVCTSMQGFFNKGSEWYRSKFYSATGFGADAADIPLPQRGFERHQPESVVGDSVHGGSSNVSAGVTRSKRRNVGAKSTALAGKVKRNYNTTKAIMFNNADEMFQDKVSREYAQEIIEDVFESWGVPLDQPEAAKYAEDMLWTFLIAVTASNKADYNVAFDIPVKPIERYGETVSSVEADFAVFSKLLESKYGKTRRQFARGVADDLKSFLKHEDNQALLPPLATRAGCEPMLAYLAFDGSTHCTGLTTREVEFTKIIESRNLFEREDVVAQGASDRLMQGMSGGVRSKTSR